MQDTVSYLNAKLVENHLEPVIDYFRSPLSVRHAEGNFRQLWSLGWAAVRRHPSLGMMWFCCTTELKALRCVLQDGVAYARRAASGQVRDGVRSTAEGGADD